VRDDVKALFAELAVPDVEVAEADLPLLGERAVANVNAMINPGRRRRIASRCWHGGLP
jgi:hypothetical protein